MRELVDWWNRRGQPERFDLVTRASLYLVLLTEPVTLFNATGAGWPAANRIAVLGFGTAQTALCLLAVRAGVDHFLGRRGRPVRLVVGAGWLALGAIVVAEVTATGSGPRADPAGWTLPVVVLVSCYFLGALCTVAPPRWAFGVAGGLALVVLLIGLAEGASAALLRSSIWMLLLGFVVLFSTFRCSLWMLGVLWELKRSRGNQVRLAVAEERLRFARDLHDVLGRNLAVVALKSELAAQLAKRDRPRAVEEMLEVRRIAQESLTEVREVVRGYRSADLDAELAGARAVLTSAGVRCRILGEGHDLSPQAQSALGWVVREGTTNVLRHSEALTCTVSVRRDRPTADPDGAGPAAEGLSRHASESPDGAGLVTLVMENDGVRPGGPPVFGNGLLGLSERLAPLGGRVTATRPGRDRFRLTAQMPLTVPPQPGETRSAEAASAATAGSGDAAAAEAVSDEVALAEAVSGKAAGEAVSGETGPAEMVSGEAALGALSGGALDAAPAQRSRS